MGLVAASRAMRRAPGLEFYPLSCAVPTASSTLLVSLAKLLRVRRLLGPQGSAGSHVPHASPSRPGRLLQPIFQDLLHEAFWPCCALRPVPGVFGHALPALLPSSSRRAPAPTVCCGTGWSRLPALGSSPGRGRSRDLPGFGIFSVLFVWTRLQSWRKTPGLWAAAAPPAPPEVLLLQRLKDEVFDPCLQGFYF